MIPLIVWGDAEAYSTVVPSAKVVPPVKSGKLPEVTIYEPEFKFSVPAAVN